MEFLSPLFRNLVQDYASSHADPRNRWIHIFGVPLIVVAVLGLLGRIEGVGGLRYDVILWAMASIFYVKNARWLAFPLVIILMLLCVVSRHINPALLWAFFIGGWSAQIFGHYYFEKNRPNVMDNLLHLLVGPFWIYLYLVRKTPGFHGLLSRFR